MDSHPAFGSTKERSNILRVSHPEEGQQLPVKEITGTQWKAIEKMYLSHPETLGQQAVQSKKQFRYYYYYHMIIPPRNGSATT